MVIPPDILGILVIFATVLVATVPFVLLLLWIKDWIRGRLW